MSIRIKARLSKLLITTTHEERRQIDLEVERRTGQDCERGIDKVTDSELVAIVQMVRNRKKGAPKLEMAVYA